MLEVLSPGQKPADAVRKMTDAWNSIRGYLGNNVNRGAFIVVNQRGIVVRVDLP